MYRRPKFLEVLLEIRREMALEADYDVDLLVEIARKGQATSNGKALATSQPAPEPLDINAEILTVSKRTSEIRKG
jgi:hypothetical protein